LEVHLSPHDGDIVSIEVHDRGDSRATLLTLTSYEACRLLLQEYEFSEILDVGSGKGQHSELFRAFGKRVTMIDTEVGADIVGDYTTTKLPHQYEAIWCSHVLEHQRNVGAFLDKIFDDLRDGGVLAITVPPVTSHWISS
jgi:2-polyprenyl-3-methyl-5-hydroxy-6-metoxy-1,4-benzoquinol methylase